MLFERRKYSIKCQEKLNFLNILIIIKKIFFFSVNIYIFIIILRLKEKKNHGLNFVKKLRVNSLDEICCMRIIQVYARLLILCNQCFITIIAKHRFFLIVMHPILGNSHFIPCARCGVYEISFMPHTLIYKTENLAILSQNCKSGVTPLY